MPSFCDPNDKPVIYYKFKGDSAYRKIQIGVAPIEIVIEPVQDFESTIRTFRSYADSQFTIAANANRKRLIFKPLPMRSMYDDVYGSYQNMRTKEYKGINNVNYQTQKGVDIVFEGSLAQDNYWLYIDSMFGNGYPFTFEYQEYF